MVSLAARASSSAAVRATSTTRRLSRRRSTSTEAAEKRPRAKSHSHYRSSISGWISRGLDTEDTDAAGEPGAKAEATGGAASTYARGVTDDKAKPPAMATDAPAPSRAWGAPNDEEEPEAAAAPDGPTLPRAVIHSQGPVDATLP